ncbi:unnamed protein product [Cuscuta campestris]|uniref:Pentatricopeptide repeat-containing protein n=1 Tax=Cuscuta campestris TaxID=132261 RepID=A0A484N468_9ASTE|nr:unnamed protein product [Cuscuta campestris]
MKHKGCYPDLVMCNMLIDCLSKMGSYDDAIIIFCSLGERGLTPDSYTLASIMSTLCLCKEFTLLPVLISGLEIIPDLVVCNSFLSFYCKAGYPRGAVEFYNDMMHRGFLPDNYTFAGLLSGLCRVGKITQAVDVLMKNILRKRCHSSLVPKLLWELWDSGCVPKDTPAPVFDKDVYDWNAKDLHFDYPSLVRDDTSSSEDIHDVAASVG